MGNPAATRGTLASGMVLSAGLGTRMAPLTDTIPKPLVSVAGRPLVDWTLERFIAAGFQRLVVNTHHHADQMRAHFANRPEITLTYEPVLQESGGGVRDALPLLGNAPFMVANADGIWFDGAVPAVDRLQAMWNPEEMDILLVLVPVENAHGYDGPGDYYLLEGGAARHRGSLTSAPFAYAGVQILKPSLFTDAPQGPFSLRELYHKAESQGRLFALVHDGAWYHIGTIDALNTLDPFISQHHLRVAE